MQKLAMMLLTLSLLLTGCAASGGSSSAESSSSEALTETDVLAAYDTAAEVYDWFDLCAPPTVGGVISVDGNDYYQVNVDGLSTYADLENRVRASFASPLSEKILTVDETCSVAPFRDIDGKLCTRAGARGENLYLIGKTVEAAKVDDAHWTLKLTFYGDSYEFDRPAATIGYTQRTLNYEETADGWRFTNFCPSDDFDWDCDTAFTFTYDDADFAALDYNNCSDLELACWLLHADGAYAEGPSDTLSHRFLTDPDAWFSALSIFADSPWENAQTVIESPAYDTYAWFTAEEQAQFENILASYQPKSEKEQALLDALKSADEKAVESAQEDAAAAFCFVGKDQYLTLGKQKGDYPWGYSCFPETPTPIGTGDNGEALFEFHWEGVTVSYFVNPDDGSSFVYRMTTAEPTVETPQATEVQVGISQAQLLKAYPAAVKYDALQPSEGADFDTVYVYEPGGLAHCKHIAFFLKDGAVTEIDMEDLLDGQLLPH